MPFRRRLRQLQITLDSYRHWYEGLDYEVLIVEDEVRRTLPELPRCRVFVSGRDGGNPSPLFNFAARRATYDVLMLTNPECAHMGNLLWDGYEPAKAGKYVCFGCRSEDSMPESFEALLANEPASDQLVGYAWYQNTKLTYMNMMLHEAAMISKSTYESVGGFSEEFVGYGYDDHDFVEKILKAGIECVTKDDPHCVHLPHERVAFEPTNEALFLEKWGHAPRYFE